MPYKEGQTLADEGATEPKVESKAELEKLPPILFAYRDNDIFGKYVADLVKAAQSSGRKVETQVFAQGTEEEEIKKWEKQHQNDLAGKQIVCDSTFMRNGDWKLDDDAKKYYEESELEKKLKEDQDKLERPTLNLDVMLEEATEQAILGGSIKSIEESEDNQVEKRNKEAFLMMLGRIFEKSENKPSEIYIAKRAITDHRPFCYLAKERLGLALEDFRDPKAIDIAAELIKQWLLESGISDGSIKIIDDILNNPDANKAGNWVLGDRHDAQKVDAHTISVVNTKYGRREEIECKAKFLQFPIGNFYSSATNEGLLQLHPGELEEALAENFRKQVLDVNPEKK